jgi:hypothetical protein
MLFPCNSSLSHAPNDLRLVGELVGTPTTLVRACAQLLTSCRLAPATVIPRYTALRAAFGPLMFMPSCGRSDRRTTTVPKGVAGIPATPPLVLRHQVRTFYFLWNLPFLPEVFHAETLLISRPIQQQAFSRRNYIPHELLNHRPKIFLSLIVPIELRCVSATSIVGNHKSK